MDLGQALQIFANISVILTLVFLGQQLKLAQNQAKGNALLEMDKQFKESEEIYLELTENKFIESDYKNNYSLWRLLGTFERCKIMIDYGLLSIEDFDNFYGYKIYALLNKSHVILVLVHSHKRSKVFIALCEQLMEYKKQQDPRRTPDRQGELIEDDDLKFQKNLIDLKENIANAKKS